MVVVCISMPTEPRTTGIGRMTSRTASEWSYGMVGLNTKEITPRGRRTATGNSYGLTRQATQANSLIITQKVRESMSGKTTGSMKESGLTIKCMGTEFSRGQTARNTQVTMLMTRRKGTENSTGRIRRSIRDSGWKEGSMEKDK